MTQKQEKEEEKIDLDECFFWFEIDENEEEEEEKEHDDRILFFHPSTIPKNKQFLFAGVLMGITHAFRNFTQEELTIFALQNNKFCIKKEKNIVMAFGAPKSEISDTILLLRHNLLIDCFKFFNKSFDHILKRANGNRETYIEYIQQAGKELLPFVTKGSNSYFARPNYNFLSAFHALPYYKIPQGFNRYFIMASQILNQLHNECGNHGGCITYNRQLLSFDLSLDLTRWILIRIFYEENQEKNVIKKNNNTNNSSVLLSLPVYLTNEQIKEFYEENLYYQDEEDQDEDEEDDDDDEESESNGSEESSNDENKIDKKKSNINISKISTNMDITNESISPLKAMMERSTIRSTEKQQNINKNSSKKTKKKKKKISLLKTTNKFHKVYTDTYKDGEYYGLHIERIGSIHLALIMDLEKLHDSEHIKKIKRLRDKFRKLEKNIINMNSNYPKKLVNNTNNSKKYNFFVFDSDTQRVKGSDLDINEKIDKAFYKNVSIGHDAFNEDYSITQVVLSDHIGTTFCRRMFGREIYFQLENKKKAKNNQSTNQIERTARKYLEKDHQIHLF
ncbi:hermansky-pudlak syndrome 4 protein light-ear protein-related [Anaeramoeba flamelloides]|uniref:Hermansky-pudlak syndrome 4 protein light-ear protein-related n=1 Tax=Anaeramoeba flamelloides TaxID=1746091 RepID=A0AAV7ZUC3_9EUKA|nr:hermansky-pudlak syndrome 4 protein light-ear protein-related [Anaeramoeba flamelloides]KAJ6252250.1 hermansky-pudlak syndrome 4 protein light-ear protein-related [Anaeramoeba flamelloides]